MDVLLELDVRQMLKAICDPKNRAFAQIDWEKRTICVMPRVAETQQESEIKYIPFLFVGKR